MEMGTRVRLENVMFRRDRSSADAGQWSLHIDKLALSAGTICSVLGENMVGKSTLLRILAGEEKLQFGNQPTSTLKQGYPNSSEMFGRLEVATSSICLLAHDDAMFPDLSLWNNVRLAQGLGRNKDRRLAQRRFRDILQTSNILRERSEAESLGRLSSGGKALVKLARACCWSAEMILIDEVTAHLDSENAFGFFETLGRFVDDDVIVLLVSHSMRDHEIASEVAIKTKMAYRSVEIKRRDDGACFIGH